MKKFISIIALFVVIVIAVGAFAGYKLMTTAITYYNADAARSEKAIAGLRQGRSLLRTQIENQTGSVSDILYKTYDILTTQTQKLINKTDKTEYIIDIQADDTIISYSINIPVFIQEFITQDAPGLGVVNIEFNTTNDGEMVAGIVAMTSGDRQTQEKEGINIEKITNSGDIVIAYTRALGVAATGIELEIFTDISHTIENAIKNGSITKIEKITYTMAYVKDITVTTGSTTMIIDPIERFDGTGANEAFAKYDPTACAASISGTNTTICTPPNGYFIYNADTGSTITLTENGGKLEIIDTTSPEGETIPGNWSEFAQEFGSKYTNIPFHVYYNTNKEIIQVTEQYIP